MPEDEANTETRELAALGAAGDGGGGEPAATVEEAPVEAPGLTAGQLARLREALVAAHPEAVPELIAGADFDALLASVEPARAAYARIRDEAARQVAGLAPRGGGVREVDPAVYADLSPEGKIAAAFARGS